MTGSVCWSSRSAPRTPRRMHALPRRRGSWRRAPAGRVRRPHSRPSGTLAGRSRRSVATPGRPTARHRAVVPGAGTTPRPGVGPRRCRHPRWRRRWARTGWWPRRCWIASIRRQPSASQPEPPALKSFAPHEFEWRPTFSRQQRFCVHFGTLRRQHNRRSAAWCLLAGEIRKNPGYPLHKESAVPYHRFLVR